jgi:hypothetical protein
MFSVGTFGANLVRALSLVLFRVAFLAAVAVTCATMLSFPVACLTTFAVYVFATLRGFLQEAIDWIPEEGATGWFQTGMEYLLEIVYLVIPNFSAFNGLEQLIDGQNVTLMWVLLGVGKLLILHTGILLLIACLVFRRRQVSEISI